MSVAHRFTCLFGLQSLTELKACSPLVFYHCASFKSSLQSSSSSSSLDSSTITLSSRTNRLLGFPIGWPGIRLYTKLNLFTRPLPGLNAKISRRAFYWITLSMIPKYFFYITIKSTWYIAPFKTI